MAGQEKFSAAQMIAAIREDRGLVTRVADRLGCSPQTVRNYCERHPSIRAALHEERERMTDLAESKLIEAIEGGEAWAVTLYLRTQGRGRGYVERQEVAGVADAPVVFTLALGDRDDDDVGDR